MKITKEKVKELALKQYLKTKLEEWKAKVEALAKEAKAAAEAPKNPTEEVAKRVAQAIQSPKCSSSIRGSLAAVFSALLEVPVVLEVPSEAAKKATEGFYVVTAKNHSGHSISIGETIFVSSALLSYPKGMVGSHQYIYYPTECRYATLEEATKLVGEMSREVKDLLYNWLRDDQGPDVVMALALEALSDEEDAASEEGGE